MRRIFFISCIFFIFIISANAGEIFNCIDRDGNSIITDTPKDGMKCVSNGEERKYAHATHAVHANVAVVQDDEDIEGFTDKETGIIKKAIKEWKQRYFCRSSYCRGTGSSKEVPKFWTMVQGRQWKRRQDRVTLN